MNNSMLLQGFNNHFEEFVSDVQTVFPDDLDVNTAANLLGTLRKANPKMIIKIWKAYISDTYGAQIEKGDISFFLGKNYGQDLQDLDGSKRVLDAIEKLRAPINAMTQENKDKSMKYIQNLTKLSNMYFS